MNKQYLNATIALFLSLLMFSCGGREYANTKISLDGAVGSFENKTSKEGYLMFHLNHVIDDFFETDDEDALDIPEEKKAIRIYLSGDNSLGKMEINSLDFLLLDTKTEETYSTALLVDSEFDALNKYSKEGFVSFVVPKDSKVEDFALGMKFLFAEGGGNSDFSRFIPLKAGENLPEENKVTQLNKSIELEYLGDAKAMFTVLSMTENIPGDEYANKGERRVSFDVKLENNSEENFWYSDPYLISKIHFRGINDSSVDGETNLIETGVVKPGESISGKIYFGTFLGDGNYKLMFSENEILEL